MSIRDWLVVSNMFYFHPKTWGRWTHFDKHMFQLGWFNHQLGTRRDTAPSFSVFLPPLFFKPSHSIFHQTHRSPLTRQQDTWNPEAWTTQRSMAPLSVEELERAVQNALEAKVVPGEKKNQLGEGWGWSCWGRFQGRSRWWGFKYFFVFSPRNLGKMNPNLTHIVQVGWKHQLEDVERVLPFGKLTWQLKSPCSNRRYIFARSMFCVAMLVY